MNDQFSFGFDDKNGLQPVDAYTPPKDVADRHVFFFAVMPPETVARRIDAFSRSLCAEHGLYGTRVGAERLHVSLHKLDRDAGELEDVLDAGRRAASTVRMGCFKVNFDTVMRFKGGGPLVLCGDKGVEPLVELHEALWVALRREHLPAKRSATPHVTLMRPIGPQVVEPHPVEPIGWTVDRFVLIHSLVGQTMYRELAYWPLSG